MLQLRMRTWRIRPMSISTALVNSTMHCKYLNPVLNELVTCSEKYLFYIILNHNCFCQVGKWTVQVFDALLFFHSKS